jgi:hypothetical protein
MSGPSVRGFAERASNETEQCDGRFDSERSVVADAGIRSRLGMAETRIVVRTIHPDHRRPLIG